jgi:predicted DNA-binding transcriptional regulator AlpA
MPTPLPDEPLWDVRDVSRQNKCAVATTWRHVKQGLLPPPIKIGGLTRWVPSEVRAAQARAMAARNQLIAD